VPGNLFQSDGFKEVVRYQDEVKGIEITNVLPDPVVAP
jgi:hypothetical protein